MYDKDKIRIMSKMAVYDKRDFERDAKAGQYFRHDFIYKRNMQMRFFLGIGCVILLFFYIMHLLAIEGADLFTVDFQAEAIRLLFYIIVLMTVYSLIGTIIYTREFLRSEKRINAYFTLMRKLDPNAIQDNEPEPAINVQHKQKKPWRIPWAKKKPEEIIEEDYEEDMPYTHYHRANLEYRYSSSDDPEFWDDDTPTR
ncbi:MAG: hypothetical protein LBE55_00115 [Clostridiales bacterium]|jgi:hypothetical protein|nr:hypothetical protein [Clostridiales bacterium]